MLGTLEPEVLRLPESLLAVLPPRPEGFSRHRELFANHTGGTFDALAPAEAAAELAFRLLLDPARAARLVQQHALDPEQPGFPELLGSVLDATWRRPAGEDYAGELRRTVDAVALTHLFALASDPGAIVQVRAVATTALADLREELRILAASDGSKAARAHHLFGAERIEQFLEHPADFVAPPPSEPPPGQPIGSLGCDF